MAACACHREFPMATHTADGNLVIQGTGALRTVPMSCAKAWRVEQPAWGLRALHLDLSQPSGSLQTWSCGKEVKRGGRHQCTGLCWVQCVESRRCVWQRMMEVVDDGISHWRGKGSSELPSGEQDAAASKWSCMRLFQPLETLALEAKSCLVLERAFRPRR